MLTQEQLDARLKCVTGSDAAVICLPENEKPKYLKTKLQLWMEKTGRIVADDIGHLNHIKFGNFFEQGVADWFQNDTCKIVHKLPVMITHESYPWMAGNIDFKIQGENAILECKTAFSPDEWGDGENTIPQHYLMQVAHYCAVGGFDRAYIAVVFALTREMRWYQYDRNKTLEDKIIAREKYFWENFVLADVCPEIETVQDIMTMYKETNANPVIADKDTQTSVEMLGVWSSQVKELIANINFCKAKIKMHMLDADTLLDENGNRLATWKYNRSNNRFDAKTIQEKEPLLCKQYMIEAKPQRKFLLKGEKD